jgi:integrase
LEEASRKVVRSYLKRFDDLSPYTYANVLKSLKRFFRDFLERPQIVSSFRFPVKPVTVKIIPSREDVERFYHALEKPIERALFLFYATSGLRRSEVTNLKFEDVDFEKRMVVPKYGQTRTKLRWISFFNEEAEKALHRYLATRKDRSNKLFRIGTHTFLDFWKRAYNKTGIHITPKVLREWFCAEMGYLGVPDRYVDAFCGRAPKSVLAKHYSDYSPKKLQEIYEKARLRVIDR